MRLHGTVCWSLVVVVIEANLAQVVHGRAVAALLLERVRPAAWLTAEQARPRRSLLGTRGVEGSCLLYSLVSCLYPAPWVPAEQARHWHSSGVVGY